jgi:hypothetical protein
MQKFRLESRGQTVQSGVAHVSWLAGTAVDARHCTVRNWYLPIVQLLSGDVGRHLAVRAGVQQPFDVWPGWRGPLQLEHVMRSRLRTMLLR